MANVPRASISHRAGPIAGLVALVAAAGAFAHLIRELFPVESLALVFLVAVIVAARWWGRWPSILASALSFLVYDFFFTEPLFRFAIADKGLSLTLLLFLVIAIITGNLSAEVRARTAAEQAAAADKVRLAAEMEEARLIAERERLRAALLSSVSHDLRTPLVSIIGAASSLIDAPQAIGAEGRRALAETIRDEGERLDRYVQNLLDMTRISGGDLALRREWIDLREIVGRAVRRLRRELRGYRVKVNMPADLPALQADAQLLEQALVNVLDNARKYAPPETDIVVAATADRARIRLTVTDRGPGIPLPDRERVFDMFYRVNAGDRSNAGTGLGLAIARGIITAHGGTIRASSGDGDRGTRIEIAFAAPAAQPAALAVPGPLAETP